MSFRLDTDSLFKHLFRREQLLIAEQIAGTKPIVEYLNVELQTFQPRRVDLVMRLADQSILHLEIQSRNDSDIAERMLEYHVHLRSHFAKQPIRSVLLYVGPEPINMPGAVVTDQLHFRYDIIDVRTFTADELLATGRPGDCAMAMLGRDGVARYDKIIERIRQMPFEQGRRVLSHVWNASQLRGLWSKVNKELEQFMPVIIDVEEDDPVIQGILNRGKAEGRVEGKAEGKAEGARQALCALLETRFGPLPQTTTSRIERAGFDQVQRWIIKAASASTLNAVFSAKRR